MMIKKKTVLCQTVVMLMFPPFWFSWKTTVSEKIFNFLCGGANKVETCQALDKSNWRNETPGANF